MPEPTTRVLFIGGEGRSGSTLLDRALGQLPGFFSGGELRELWDWGLRRNALCGCGTPFLECPFWTGVGEEAFGGWGRIDPWAVDQWARAAERLGTVAALARRPGRLDPAAVEYGRLLRLVYRAIQRRSGASVIVDSSKSPSIAFVLRAAGLDVRAVHLVRDSRGVAYSWSKVVPRPDAGGVEMRRFGPVRTAGRWVGRNLLMEVLARSGTPTERIRYEDLVSQPAEALTGAAALAGVAVGPSSLPLRTDGRLELQADHMVMGNPLRMRTGPLQLRLDDEWTRRMPAGSRRVVRLMTWPLSRWYGYRG